MTRLLRRMVVALAALSSLFAPLNSAAESVLDFSLRSENRLAMTMLSDAFSDSEVTFSASQENGVTELQVDLDGQSIYVRKSAGELHIRSSKNTDRTFGTLSEDEKVVLGTMAKLMVESLEQENRFYAAAGCMMNQLSYWPSEMPLMVSLDPVQLTVGDLRLDREEMKEARRQALAEAAAREQQETPQGPLLWTSLCDAIGFKRSACYPISLIPYRERCDAILVGGRWCTGRCGTLCSDWVLGTKYTQYCYNHDRCTGVYSMTHRYCNFILPLALEDACLAPDCDDLPGVWRMTYQWDGFAPHYRTLYIYPNHSYWVNDRPRTSGYWSHEIFTIRFSSEQGCRPRHTAEFFDAERLSLTGEMNCADGSGSHGYWLADKTSLTLPAQAAYQESDNPNDGSGSAWDSPAPSTTDVGPHHTEVEK